MARTSLISLQPPMVHAQIILLLLPMPQTGVGGLVVVPRVARVCVIYILPSGKETDSISLFQISSHVRTNIPGVSGKNQTAQSCLYNNQLTMY